ncbi:hypothetical protein GGQ22_11605 [Nocardioides sp. zg-579]|uniref:Uncharacterized protein n=1 Tax=Nocardioides marmotae TaxID=2663857 RepID=A0A6I3JC45_9ACTN|nr:hypothetical protein [Nocardioides marmotae]MCR6032087.1 hypothetical protein [Gordonia jinghuaiqii]MTB95732.1 hypothetical protein [Nocardioides marmotae]QKE01131.1 hypothetical protein HPC71_08665 [Nocardioides marmotae]
MRALLLLEETAAAIMRLVAHALLTGIPDLTAHARHVLAAWREHGAQPYRGHTRAMPYADIIDSYVRRIGAHREVTWAAEPPAAVLSR